MKSEKEKKKREDEGKIAGMLGEIANMHAAKVSSRKEKRIKWEL